jgi:hypothetical protein
MQLRRLLVAVSIAILLGAGPAAAASPERVAEAFRAGCLDQLPHFGGSSTALRKLGFVPVGDSFRLETPEGEILAHVMLPGADGVAGCLVNAELAPDAGITALVAAAIAEMTENRFRHKGVETEGVRAETFAWRSGGVNASVALVPDVMGMHSLSVLAGRVAE